jgi:hypothetical protein
MSIVPPITQADWQAEAWRQICSTAYLKRHYGTLSIDEVLAHKFIGHTVCALARKLQVDAEREATGIHRRSSTSVRRAPPSPVFRQMNITAMQQEQDADA